VVVGRNIANHLPQYLSMLPEASNNTKFTTLTSAIWTPPQLTNTQPITLSLTNLTSAYNKNSNINFSHTSKNTIRSNVNTDDIGAQLKILMSSNMGITRSAEQLQQALVQIQQWHYQINSSLSQSKSLENQSKPLESRCLGSVDSPITLNNLAGFQLARQLQLATLIVQSASQRCESRGGHYRQDYPSIGHKPLISVIEPVSKTTNDDVDLESHFMLNNISQRNWQGLTAV
jgi:L-aspartate oxidase